MRGRWNGTMLHSWYFHDGAILGTCWSAGREKWDAHGCNANWRDTPLGTFSTRETARERVEQWVKETKPCGESLEEGQNEAAQIIEQNLSIQTLKLYCNDCLAIGAKHDEMAESALAKLSGVMSKIISAVRAGEQPPKWNVEFKEALFELHEAGARRGVGATAKMVKMQLEDAVHPDCGTLKWVIGNLKTAMSQPVPSDENS